MKRLLLAFGFILALAGCGRGGEGDEAVLHIGSQRGGTKAVMLASGVMEGAPYKVEWSEFPAAQHLLEAIGSGAVDVGLVGDAPFMFAYQSGGRVKAIGAQYVKERPEGALALLVPAGSKIRTLADLKGKTVATGRGSVGHYLIIRALAAANLPADYVKISFLPPGDAKADFDSGSVDAWSTWAPYTSATIREGARTIVDGHDFVRGYGFDVANVESVKAKHALLADFLKREAQALEWKRAHNEEFAAVMAKETGLPIEIARDYGAKNGRQSVPIDAEIIADQQRVLDDFRNAGAIEGKRKLADGFDTSFNTKVATAN